MSAHTGNPAPGVGGTASDGGISTADTVADGGPSEQGSSGGGPDSTYQPPASADSVPEGQHYTRSSNAKSSGDGTVADGDGNGDGDGGEAHVGNPARGVGGTAKDGGLSTADTVADGGPDEPEEDGTYKP